MSASPSSASRGLRDYVERALRPERRAETLLIALCFIVLGLAVQWRVVYLDFPPSFTFDEHHFVENARNYIQQRADWNDHPPLGKLILVPSMLAFGDNSLSWRLPAMTFGLALVAVAYFTGVALFRTKRAGLLAATLVAADGFFISFSRTALLDIPMAT
ncbi:MAG TPA: phospholipid carrier-dependent glycosyltransferase, partial [Polyangiaceae bacterium]